MTVPEYLEDISELEEVLSPAFVLPPPRSPGGSWGKERRDKLVLIILPVGTSFTFLGSYSSERPKDFRSKLSKLGL